MFERYQKAIDQIIEEYTTGDYFREIYEAKKDYFAQLGLVPEDDPDFDNQMDIFMGWYLFDRPLVKHEISPVNLYFRKARDQMSEEEIEVYNSLVNSRHSVFELLKIKNGCVVVRDLSNKEKLEVLDDTKMCGFSKGDVFQARLIPHQKSFLFAKGFCFHPKDASKFIEGQMKKIRADDHQQRIKILLKLGQMRNKIQRFPHIDSQHIYTLTPKF
ncbi:MAG: hypothetical protein M9962_11765 [Oligoflexia bacterium]|nr:hypothetical protein [Oligoflexia bacterium]